MSATPGSSNPAPRIGSYELLSELGRGGMGAVFRARHLPTGALRAVKIFAGANEPEQLLRFEREAQAMARVAGAGIVTVHETGRAGGRLFFAMALMPGGSLRARLRARGALPWRDAVALVASLARTLDRCHAAGLLHRDLKPDNVLFDEEDRPNLADFGCVRDLASGTLTEAGLVLGTLAYMPPEQLDGEKVDARADVYALGVLLHELVAGEPPFTATAALSQFAEKKRGRSFVLAARVAGVPGALDRLIDRALAVRPEDRPPSMEALARDLDALLGGDDGLAKEPPLVGSRAALALVALGALAALGGVLAGVASRHRPSPPPPPRIETVRDETGPVGTRSPLAPRVPRSPGVAAVTSADGEAALARIGARKSPDFLRVEQGVRFLDDIRPDVEIIARAGYPAESLGRGIMTLLTAYKEPLAPEQLIRYTGLARAASPRDATDFTLQLAHVLKEKGEATEAIALLEPLIEARDVTDEQRTNAIDTTITICQASGNTDRPLALLRSVCARGVASHSEKREFCRYALVLGSGPSDLEAALAAADSALADGSERDAMLVYRALILSRLGRQDDALRTLERVDPPALRSDRGTLDAAINLAQTLGAEELRTKLQLVRGDAK